MHKKQNNSFQNIIYEQNRHFLFTNANYHFSNMVNITITKLYIVVSQNKGGKIFINNFLLKGFTITFEGSLLQEPQTHQMHFMIQVIVGEQK